MSCVFCVHLFAGQAFQACLLSAWCVLSISLQCFCTCKIQISSLTPDLLTAVCKNLPSRHPSAPFLHQTQGTQLLSGSSGLQVAGEPGLGVGNTLVGAF